jgi:hypothetical protein
LASYTKTIRKIRITRLKRTCGLNFIGDPL